MAPSSKLRKKRNLDTEKKNLADAAVESRAACEASNQAVDNMELTEGQPEVRAKNANGKQIATQRNTLGGTAMQSVSGVASYNSAELHESVGSKPAWFWKWLLRFFSKKDKRFMSESVGIQVYLDKLDKR